MSQTQAKRICESKGYILPEIHFPEEEEELKKAMAEYSVKEVHAGVEPIVWENTHRFMYTGARMDKGYIQHAMTSIKEYGEYKDEDFLNPKYYMGNFRYTFAYTNYVAFKPIKHPDFYYKGYMYEEHLQWYMDGKFWTTQFPEVLLPVLCQTVKPDVEIITAIANTPDPQKRFRKLQLHKNKDTYKNTDVSYKDTKRVMTWSLQKAYKKQYKKVDQMVAKSMNEWENRAYIQQDDQMTIEFGGGTPIMCRNVYFAAIEQVDRLENRLKGALGLFRIKVTDINLRQASGTSYEEKLELIRQANVFQKDEQRRDKRNAIQNLQEVKGEKEEGAAAQSLPPDDFIDNEQEREERAVAQFLQFGKILLEGGSPLVGILREGLSLFKTMQTDKRQDEEIAQLRTNIAQQAKRIDDFVVHQSLVNKTVRNIIDLINKMIPAIASLAQQLDVVTQLNNLYININRLGEAVAESIDLLEDIGYYATQHEVSPRLFSGPEFKEAIEQLNIETDKIFKHDSDDMISAVVINPMDNTELLAIVNTPGYSKKRYIATELYAVPSATWPIRYKPKINLQYAAIDEEGKTYFEMTSPQYDKCQFEPCLINSAVRSMYEDICGPPLLNRNQSSLCSYFSDPIDHKPVGHELSVKMFAPDGLIYSTNSSVAVRLDCSYTLDFNVTSVKGEGIINVPKGCQVTVGNNGEFTVAGPPSTYKAHIAPMKILEHVPPLPFNFKELINSNIMELPILQDLQIQEVKVNVSQLSREINNQAKNLLMQLHLMGNNMEIYDATLSDQLESVYSDIDEVSKELDEQQEEIEQGAKAVHNTQIIGMITIIVLLIITGSIIYLMVRYKKKILKSMAFLTRILGLDKQPSEQMIINESRETSYKGYSLPKPDNLRSKTREEAAKLLDKSQSQERKSATTDSREGSSIEANRSISSIEVHAETKKK